MIEVGYKLSSEEFGPRELVAQAKRAEEVGFDFALISDHFHPWTDRQGQSPFVWTVLGGIASETSRLKVATGVTCPTIRTHPAIIAQAAATTAALMPGRFSLGVGTGENLNEHVVGCGWPAPDLRLEMLEEAIEVIRLLWEGGVQTHRGPHFTVESARLYTLPPEPPPILVGASKSGAVDLAGRAGDGMVNTEVDGALVKDFQTGGGEGKPCYVEISVCWDEDESRARKTAHEVWALAALEGMLFTDLRLPSQFEATFKHIEESEVAEKVICGPDAEKFIAAIADAERTGYTNVCLHQIGPKQGGFFDFCSREVLPQVASQPGRNARRKRAS